VAQRVSRAEVRVGEELAAQMGTGLLALVGVASADTEHDARQLADKLVCLRVFPDAEGRMNCSLLDIGGELGIISQFTLLGDCRKGRRPSYDEAAPAQAAEPLIERLVEQARACGVRVVTGRFRARMQVSLVNEGPVTLLLDTARRF
jgi:D-tyrosyl-tRNA(Tyr) deacylase